MAISGIIKKLPALSVDSNDGILSEGGKGEALCWVLKTAIIVDAELSEVLVISNVCAVPLVGALESDIVFQLRLINC